MQFGKHYPNQVQESGQLKSRTGCDKTLEWSDFKLPWDFNLNGIRVSHLPGMQVVQGQNVSLDRLLTIIHIMDAW